MTSSDDPTDRTVETTSLSQDVARRLEDLDAAELVDHPAVFEDAHAMLREALSDTGDHESPGPA